LIENFGWNIPLERYGYLKLKHGFLLMGKNSILMARCLRAGRAPKVFRRNLISRHLGTFAAVFQAEVYAFLACSDYCFALSSHTVSSRLAVQCRNSLQGLSIPNRVQMFWVPGHCGMIIGNEEADDLAGVGSKSNFYRLEPCLPVPKSLMTRMTKKMVVSQSSFLLESG
jgi:hypothetical protein